MRVQAIVDNDLALDWIRGSAHAAVLDTEVLSIRNLGILAGDNAHAEIGARPHQDAMASEAKQGRLELDPSYDAEQIHLHNMPAVLVSRLAVAAWLREHATAEYSASRLAAWAHFKPKE